VPDVPGTVPGQKLGADPPNTRQHHGFGVVCQVCQVILQNLDGGINRIEESLINLVGTPGTGLSKARHGVIGA